MKKMLTVLMLLVISAGCAIKRPPMSREEWLAVSSRHYEGATKEQVISAAEKILRLADGDDFKIVHTEEGIYASRNWSVYLILAATMGTDYWKFKVVQEDNTVMAVVQINRQQQAVTPMATSSGAWTATTMPMAGIPVDGTAIYDVFWSRMDYLLGVRSEWMSCKVADERVRLGVVWGSNEALCNSFNVKDDTPTSPILVMKGEEKINVNN